MVGTLSAPVSIGEEHLRRLGLTTEVGTDLKDEKLKTIADLVISAHAPWHLVPGKVRSNIAATDDEHRRASIEQVAQYIRELHKFPRVKKVVMHPGAKQIFRPEQEVGQWGTYERLIEAIQELGDVASACGLKLVMENNLAFWETVPEETPPEEADRSQENDFFGTTPEEWFRICEDVGRPSVLLCLDSSHSSAYGHLFSDYGKRLDIMMAYMAKPEYIDHVHWSDGYLYDVRGRKDCHLSVGKGTIPKAFHQEVKRLKATLLLEHFHSIAELEEELAFVAAL